MDKARVGPWVPPRGQKGQVESQAATVHEGSDLTERAGGPRRHGGVLRRKINAFPI